MSDCFRFPGGSGEVLHLPPDYVHGVSCFCLAGVCHQCSYSSDGSCQPPHRHGVCLVNGQYILIVFHAAPFLSACCCSFPIELSLHCC